jgi:thiamine biosynthesis protein ThiS
LRIQVNGEPQEVEENISLPKLVADLNLKAEQIAIELNHNVVRRAQWNNTLLQADDKVEIVHFVGGGCNQARSGRQ